MDPGVDLLAGLRDIRQPALTQWDLLADGLMAFAAGLLAALLLAMLIRTFMRRKTSRRETALAELEATRQLIDNDRLLAQAMLLQRIAFVLPSGESENGASKAGHWTAKLDARTGTAFFAAGAGADLRKALYQPGAQVDPEQIDSELVTLMQTIKD